MRQNGLFDMIADPDFGTRDRAVRLVRRIPESDPSFDVRLARQIPERPGYVRSTAAWMMGRLVRPELVPDLKVLAADASPMVRSAALRALVEIRKAEGKSIDAAMPAEPVGLTKLHIDAG